MPRLPFSVKPTRIVLIAVATVLTATLLGLEQVPANKPNHLPAWWFRRGVISPVSTSSSAVTWPQSYAPSQDYSAVNLGQLRQLASAAYLEFEAAFSGGGGAGPEITALVKTFCQFNGGQIITDSTGRAVPLASALPSNYGAANLGQVKAVAEPFYRRLEALGRYAVRPWKADGEEDDFAVANSGQAKNGFSFFTDPDADADGLPDDWEAANGLSATEPLDALMDFDGDYKVNLTEWEMGTNPRDPYDGAAPPGPPAAPSNVRVRTNEDGSLDISWTDNSNNEFEFIVRIRNASGVLVEVGRLGPNETSLHVPFAAIP